VWSHLYRQSRSRTDGKSQFQTLYRGYYTKPAKTRLSRQTPLLSSSRADRLRERSREQAAWINVVRQAKAAADYQHLPSVTFVVNSSFNPPKYFPVHTASTLTSSKNHQFHGRRRNRDTRPASLFSFALFIITSVFSLERPHNYDLLMVPPARKVDLSCELVRDGRDHVKQISVITSLKCELNDHRCFFGAAFALSIVIHSRNDVSKRKERK
jgi:hypothetical protein